MRFPIWTIIAFICSIGISLSLISWSDDQLYIKICYCLPIVVVITLYGKTIDENLNHQ